MLRLLYLIPLLPLIAAGVNGIFGKQLRRTLVSVISCGLVSFSFLIALGCFSELLKLPPAQRRVVLFFYNWIQAGSFQARLAYLLDPLSMTMILIVTGIGFLIHVYSVGYMAEDPGYYRFFAYLNLFICAMSVLVLADNYLLMFVGWEGVGLCSYLLIGFYLDRKSAGDAAKKAFVVNRVGDFGFALGLLLIFATFGSVDYTTVFDRVAEQASGPEGGFGVLSWIALLLFIGATGKSAQIPLYVWLPDAMEGPTPVSALIHAATMVTAGVYMVVRSNAIYSRAPQVMLLVAVTGIATALLAATIGLVQRDIKRVLAYSTVSQLGYMFVALGVGAFTAGIFHLLTHAFFKALLFLGAGSVIHGIAHEQDLFRMGGLRKYLPWTCATMWVATLAIAGVPLFAGFFSKDEILWKAYSSPLGSPVIWAVGVVTAGLTAFYMFRLMFLTFHGEERFSGGSAQESDPSLVIGHQTKGRDQGSGASGQGSAQESHRSSVDSHQISGGHGPSQEYPPSPKSLTPIPHPPTPHESPWVMVGPLVVLAVFSVIGGYVMVPGWFKSWFKLGNQSLEHFLEPVFERQWTAAAAHADPTVEINVMAIAVLVAALGMLVAYILYVARPELPAQLSSRFRALYTVLYHKYYVDEAYDTAFVHPIHRTSETFLWRAMDVFTIDGAVNGVASLLQDAGDFLKRMQSGYTRAYGSWILFGAFLVLLYLVVR